MSPLSCKLKADDIHCDNKLRIKMGRDGDTLNCHNVSIYRHLWTYVPIKRVAFCVVFCAFLWLKKRSFFVVIFAVTPSSTTA